MEMMGSESSDGDENDPSIVKFNGMSHFGGEFFSMANGMNKESSISIGGERAGVNKIAYVCCLVLQFLLFGVVFSRRKANIFICKS